MWNKQWRDFTKNLIVSRDLEKKFDFCSISKNIVMELITFKLDKYNKYNKEIFYLFKNERLSKMKKWQIYHGIKKYFIICIS
jgi:hypothetical protein